MARRFALLCATLFVALSIPATAVAAPIKGKLSKRGFTVVAIAQDGTTKSAAARTGKFTLKVRSGTYALQLRGRDGRYAGPVVVGITKSKRAILGVKSGAKLGDVRVLKGYAKPAKALKKRFRDTKITSKAKRGVPIGAGKLGLVRSAVGRPAQQEPPPGQPGGAPQPPGGDPDADGVPNAIDIDDNGNLVLDAVDPTQAAPSSGFRSFSQIFLDIDETVNANAAAVSDAQIDAAMVESLELVLLGVKEGTELDCGGLSYCSAGGTGTLSGPPEQPGRNGEPFPGCCDDDGDGFGTLQLTAQAGGSEFRLRPNAGSDAIGSGDTMIQRVPDDSGGQTELPGTINFVFNTVPAITSWADGAGGGGTVSYPAPANAEGTSNNPFPIGKSPSGDYELTLTFWRPQRRPVPGVESAGELIDIGGLGYDFAMPNPPGTPQPGQPGPGGNAPAQCPISSLSEDDPNLTFSSDQGIPRAIDSAADRPASAANTLTVMINLTECASAKGGTFGPAGPGQPPVIMDIAANAVSATSVDHANQNFYVKAL